MISAGVDIGSNIAKAVLLQNGTVLSSAVVDITKDNEFAAEEVLRQVLNKANLSIERIAVIEFPAFAVLSKLYHVVIVWTCD